MSIQALRNSIAIIDNPEWSDGAVHGHNAPHNISYFEYVTSGFQTLSTSSANSEIEGLLYVPDLESTDVCKNLSAAYVPRNATRQANLPPTDYNLIALVPWFNSSCSLSYMEAASKDPIRALIFYQPNTTTVPLLADGAWSTDDGGAWKSNMHYPVYGIPGTLGARMMTELSLYSGNVTDVPNGHELIELNVDPRDYVRVATKIFTDSGSTSLDIWVFLLIVVGSLLVIIVSSFISIHVIQRKRREALRRRIIRGDVDLEALGIKRLTVPNEIIESMPLYVYSTEDDDDERSIHDVERTDHDRAACPKSPTSIVSPTQASVTMVGSGGCRMSDLRPKKFVVTHSQPTCPICLEEFESGVTMVRELLCHHIYHPECIDTVLSCDSSLCPMCKKSMIPVGYCPTVITNSMVRRERMLRRLRSRVTLDEDGTPADNLTWRTRVQELQYRLSDHFSATTRVPHSPTVPATVTLQMQPQYHHQRTGSGMELPPPPQLQHPPRVFTRDARIVEPPPPPPAVAAS